MSSPGRNFRDLLVVHDQAMRLFGASIVVGVLVMGCGSSSPTPSGPSGQLTLQVGNQTFVLDGPAVSSCFIYGDANGNHVFISRRLSAAGYFIEAALSPFTPPGTVTNFVPPIRVVNGGQVMVAFEDRAGRDPPNPLYYAASGTLRAATASGPTMSWYADLNLINGRLTRAPTARLVGSFSCSVIRGAPGVSESARRTVPPPHGQITPLTSSP
jgi:hypothetical protein